ncbi:MAG: M48 family metalloprotease [Proteobacteria bacterium]|nr:M48 family metalloprotease [Pseudomonadota bacterium]
MNNRGMTRALALLALAAAIVQGCTTNPATGGSDFTPFMSRSQEKTIGAQQHPEILKQFGGAYNNAKVTDYVTLVGRQVAANCELADEQWTFTVLNSPVPNAFALPVGYVYVTRGLLALVNSEAELAGVLGHEVGHVTARHSAKRYSSATGVGIGAAILGAVTGSDVQKIAETGGAIFLSSYSRSQEYQSDDLGIRYLERTGYDPYAQADVLNGLGLVSAVEARAAGRSTGGSDFFSTHPNTPDRVARADAKASETGVPRGAKPRYTDRYLNNISGMIYGDDPEQGVVVGNSFLHAPLAFGFSVPQRFTLINTTDAVLAQGPNGVMMAMSGARMAAGTSMQTYLVNEYGKSVTVQNVQTMRINGMQAATGTAQITGQNGVIDARLVVICFEGERVYRFQFLSAPQRTASVDPTFRQIAGTFRRLTNAERQSVPDLWLQVVTVGRGDSVDRLAARMATPDYKRERFLALNGLTDGAQLKAGQRVKIVVAK